MSWFFFFYFILFEEKHYQPDTRSKDKIGEIRTVSAGDTTQIPL